jgi:hypothetical protein
MQLQEMPALISNVIESLRLFEERRQLAMESSRRQAAQYAAVSQAIDDLVGSIQFHDITRQQVEHVVQALRHLRNSWRSGHGVEGSSSLDTRSILTLQSSQLAEAARTFASSIERMQGDLENIGARVENASEAVQALMGFSGSDQDSFFAKMEGQFAAILKMLGTCSAAQAEMDSTAPGLEELSVVCGPRLPRSGVPKFESNVFLPTPPSGLPTLERPELRSTKSPRSCNVWLWNPTRIPKK